MKTRMISTPLAAALVLAGAGAFAQDNTTNSNTSPVPNNPTSINDMAAEPQPWPGQNQTYRDNPNPFNANQQTQDSSLQAEQSAPNLPDSEIKNRVQQRIGADPDLATRSGNVRVTSRRGHVILRGTVLSQADKDNFGAKAAEVAGPENVTNYLRVH